jgi:hypothetical protein
LDRRITISDRIGRMGSNMNARIARLRKSMKLVPDAGLLTDNLARKSNVAPSRRRG